MTNDTARRNRLMIWSLLGVALFLACGTIVYVAFRG